MKLKDLVEQLKEINNTPKFWKGLFLGYFITDVISYIL